MFSAGSDLCIAEPLYGTFAVGVYLPNTPVHAYGIGVPRDLLLVSVGLGVAHSAYQPI
jgi:hypothetical protein